MPSYRSPYGAAEKLFEATLEKVKGQFEVTTKDHRIGLKLLSRFDELKNYKSLFVHKVTELNGKNSSVIVLLIERHLTITVQKRTGVREKDIEEVEPVLLFNNAHDIGRVFIRAETVVDKILDVMIKVDIDFPGYPDFSRNYYVAAEKPELVKEYLSKPLIKTLDKVKGMIVEINGNWGLLRTEMNLTEDVLLLLFSIGYKLTSWT
jgi:hypothetical protein